MKSSARRSKKYAAKIRGLVLPGQSRSFAQSVPGQVQIELAVKTAMAQLGIPAMFTNYYILFAKNIAKHIGIERDVEYNKWFQRGMRHDWLRWIGHTINRARLNTTGISDRHDPVGFWAFSRGSGSQALDYSGYNNHGTLQNSPGWVDGVIGNALSFNGVNQFVNCGNDPSLNFGIGNFTISAWINTSSSKVGQIIYTKATLPSLDEGVALYFHTSSSRLRFEYWNTVDGVALDSMQVINDGDWHHVIGIRNTTIDSIYIDGNLSVTGISKKLNADNNGDALIGTDNDSPTTLFNGSIDEVRVWGRALSAEEVRRIYESERLV